MLEEEEKGGDDYYLIELKTIIFHKVTLRLLTLLRLMTRINH